MEPPATTRFKLTVHYDGTAYHGWQLQPDQRTVQGDLESALGRLAAEPRRILAAGRTDTGVHATGQVASVDMPGRWTARRLRGALNALLPDDVWIERVDAVPADFHPRYDAVARSYGYRIGTEDEASSPLHRRWCWPLARALDLARLRAAAEPLVGTHSFLAFAKAGQPERGEICTVAVASWDAWKLGVELTITADRYLHHMVRYLVGTMVDVALERRPIEDISRLLDRDPEVTTSPPAPPTGLFLRHVDYPSDARAHEEAGHPTPRSTATA